MKQGSKLPVEKKVKVIVIRTLNEKLRHNKMNRNFGRETGNLNSEISAQTKLVRAGRRRRRRRRRRKRGRKELEAAEAFLYLELGTNQSLDK